jgi:hypothetical protein
MDGDSRRRTQDFKIYFETCDRGVKAFRLSTIGLCIRAAATMLPVIDDAAVSIQLKVTAGQQRVLDFGARALDPGFSSGKGNSQLCRQLCLRQPIIFCQDQSLAIGLGKCFDHISQRESFCRVRLVRHGCRRNVNLWESGFTAEAVMINDGISGDLINPALQFIRGHQRVDAAMDSQEYLLQNVFGGGSVSHTPPNELKQAIAKVAPNSFRIVHESY